MRRRRSGATTGPMGGGSTITCGSSAAEEGRRRPAACWPAFRPRPARATSSGSRSHRTDSLRRVRRATLAPAVAVLLAAPTVLAYFSGGYFEEPRLWAAMGACALALLAAL